MGANSWLGAGWWLELMAATCWDTEHSMRVIHADICSFLHPHKTKALYMPTPKKKTRSTVQKSLSHYMLRAKEHCKMAQDGAKNSASSSADHASEE